MEKERKEEEKILCNLRNTPMNLYFLLGYDLSDQYYHLKKKAFQAKKMYLERMHE